MTSKLPQDVDDASLSSVSSRPREPGDPPTHMTYAIHLFKLSRINSEIKYVLHSIVRETPSYAYPAIRSLEEWQADVVQRLDQWATDIPRHGNEHDYMFRICQTRYHSMKMLLLRPSPGLPQPDAKALEACYHNAIHATRLFNELYRNSTLVYSWVTFHSIMLSIITLFYCIWTVPDIAYEAKLDVLMADLRAASSILSATGEHWSGAKRSRDLLEELASKTIRRIIELRGRSSGLSRNTNGIFATSRNSETARRLRLENSIQSPRTNAALLDPQNEAILFQQDGLPDFSADPIASLFNDPVDTALDLPSSSFDLDAMMRDVFDGFVPTFLGG